MPSTPVVSVRASAEHAKLIRSVAAALRRDPAAADKVLRALGQNAPPHPSANLGPFRDDKAALAFLRDRLAAHLRPLAIILFGSRARGGARPDSDFDLLVIYPDDAGEAAAQDYDRAYQPVLGSGLACDVVPCLERDFLADRDQPGTLCHAAAAEGRMIYAKPGSRWSKIA